MLLKLLSQNAYYQAEWQQRAINYEYLLLIIHAKPLLVTAIKFCAGFDRLTIDSHSLFLNFLINYN